MVAAFVKGRLEYLKEKICSKRTFSKTSTVSSKSFSLSPGKATIMSVEMLTFGQSSLSFKALFKYHSLV